MIISSFIIQANVITIVNYDRQTLIVQATGGLYHKTYYGRNFAHFRNKLECLSLSSLSSLI
jgi:hypothetical protein